jgi:hypothetical protein
MLSRPLSLAVLAGLLIACGTPTGSPTGTQSGISAGSNPAAGQWGGPDVSLELTEAGGRLEYPCAMGTIDAGWTLSEDGSFSGTGRHFFGGGPASPEGHPPHPARYQGALHDGTLTLTVILLDLPDTLGPFAMQRGRYAVSQLCL